MGTSERPPAPEPQDRSGAGGGRARRVRGSLGTPIVLAVVAANAVSFAVLVTIVQAALERDRAAIQRDYVDQLASHLGDVVDGLGRIRARPLLDWRGWRWFEDVIVAQAPRRGLDGRFAVEGAYLNPLGASHRDAGFDGQEALSLIAAAVDADAIQVSADLGAAVPIGRPGAQAWGGAWFTPRPIEVSVSPVTQILPYFLVTLLATTLVILWLLRRKVIEPLGSLATAARALEAGDLRARVSLPDGREDEIGALSRGFDDMAARLQRYSEGLEEAVTEATQRARSAEVAAMTQRRLAATGELAAGIAHELNNPLGGLLNAVEALRRSDLEPARREEYLALVKGGLERMGETVGRLLRLSPRNAAAERAEVARPLGDALGLVRHRAEDEGVAVRVVGPEGAAARDAFAPDALAPLAALPAVHGAANDLGQVFLNLLVNSLDAIAEARRDDAAAPGAHRHGGAGAIEITAGRSDGDGAVTLGFRDDGPGVPDDRLPRIADAFFTTKSQGEGSGLGLAIVHNVVAAHGGRVLLDGRPGEGLAVTVLLPPAGDGAPPTSEGATP